MLSMFVNVVNKVRLDEYWGNLNALSSEARDFLRVGTRHDGSSSIYGPNSKVNMFKATEKSLYSLMKEYSNIIIQYRQDDLFGISIGYGEGNVREFDDWDRLVSEIPYSDRPDLQRTIKSESGANKFISTLCKFLGTRYNLKPKDVLTKITYQVVDSDEHKAEVKTNRASNRVVNPTITKNDKTLPSNKFMTKDNLKTRLKAYIETKLPNYDINNLPKDQKLLKTGVAFKVKGVKYSYDATDSMNRNLGSVERLLSGNESFVAFRDTNGARYDIDCPRLIVYVLKLVDNKIQVVDVRGSDGYGISNAETDILPLSNWTFEEKSDK